MHELDSVPAAEGAQRRLVHYDENAAAMSQSRHAPATRRRMERSYEHQRPSSRTRMFSVAVVANGDVELVGVPPNTFVCQHCAEDELAGLTTRLDAEWWRPPLVVQASWAQPLYACSAERRNTRPAHWILFSLRHDHGAVKTVFDRDLKARIPHRKPAGSQKRRYETRSESFASAHHCAKGCRPARMFALISIQWFRRMRARSSVPSAVRRRKNSITYSGRYPTPSRRACSM